MISIDQEYLDKYANSSYLETHTGRKFWVARPRLEDITVLDIAHALALKCRYNGHCRSFYSVAEHSTTLALYARHIGLPASTQLQLLMHDGNEAYLPDVPRPIKHFFPDLILMEKAIDALIREFCHLPDELPEEVHQFDSRILHDEKVQVMLPSGNKWICEDLQPLGVILNGHKPAEAESRFLQAFQVMAREYLSRPVLTSYVAGEFARGSSDKVGYVGPDIQLIDVLGSCALAKDEYGLPYYIHGDFKLFVPS